ncbi:HAD-IC family P-type ATPase, partial [Candidatus Marithioploca araucensis]|nr:HAD-IC family P-type ATPase [Candidatus Marithioploca araucensis]
MFIQIALIGGAVVGWAAYGKKKKSKSKVLSAHRVKDEFKNALTDKKSEQQITVQSLDEGQNPPEVVEIVGNNVVIGAGSTVCALLGSVSSWFLLPAALGVLYLARNSVQAAIRDIKNGKYISVFVVSSGADIGMLITGHVVIAASAAFIGDLFFRLIERTQDNTTKQLVNVFGEPPEKIWLLKDGVEVQVGFTSVGQGDTVVISAGEIIPVDGTIREGMATIDQHILTGESQPVEKIEGYQVFASTLILTGRIYVLVEKTGQDTVAAKIGSILNNTQEYKNTLMNRGQEITEALLPLQVGISGVTLVLLGATSAITVLWASLGLTMVALGPITALNYLRLFSRRGILIKDGRVLETLHKVDTVIFDKTGTLTLEQPQVCKIHCLSEWDEDTVLLYAAAAEYRQPHPIAKAIFEKAADLEIE